MRVVVLGATGNVGTSLLEALADEARVESVLGLARRLPELELPKVAWARADVSSDDLLPHFRGADCVVHFAWKIQPSRAGEVLRMTNVHGSSRVFLAAAETRVPALVYASSVGAYSPGPKDRRVDESWPTNGVRTSFYARQKAEVERILDRFERDRPETRVVRLRPGLIFKREAASGIRRLFAGPFLPSPLLHPRLLPLVPDLPRLRFQAVHSRDVGEAYRLAIVGDARGAFNVAAEPVLDPPELARLLGSRRVRIPEPLARAATALTWRLHLQPAAGLARPGARRAAAGRLARPGGAWLDAAARRRRGFARVAGGPPRGRGRAHAATRSVDGRSGASARARRWPRLARVSRGRSG
jgi:UDP-glucose 4-epimerase